MDKPRALSPQRLTEAEFARGDFRALVPEGFSYEDVLKPEFWSLVAGRIQRGDMIEATQWRQHGDHNAVLCGYIGNDGRCFTVKPPYEAIECAVIKTLEGWHAVSEGDWIITGVKGEHYPCKPDIFEQTYEPA